MLYERYEQPLNIFLFISYIVYIQDIRFQNITFSWQYSSDYRLKVESKHIIKIYSSGLVCENCQAQERWSDVLPGHEL